MRIDAVDYFDAARERLTQANLLYDKAHYSIALYVGGVAVESLLRAYVVRLDPKLEAAHNLPMLLKASNLRAFTTPIEYQQTGAAIVDLFKRWKNDLRYISNSRLRRRLKKQKLDRGIRGDYLKENCRIGLETTTTILRIGVAKWKQS